MPQNSVGISTLGASEVAKASATRAVCMAGVQFNKFRSLKEYARDGKIYRHSGCNGFVRRRGFGRGGETAGAGKPSRRSGERVDTTPKLHGRERPQEAARWVCFRTG